MARQFTATVLMERPWAFRPKAMASALEGAFPNIGHIDLVPGDQPGAAGALSIDGAKVALANHDSPLPFERLSPPMKVLRNWNPEPAVERHAAHIDITCGGDLPGLEGAEAYAAAVTFVAAAVCASAPATAIFWRESWSISSPRMIADAAQRLMSGHMPIGVWVSYASVVPKGYKPEQATGMVTYGMRSFIGRELELAPRPGDARSAWNCISAVARMTLDRGLKLADGRRIEDSAGAFAMVVRERNFWLRRDLSAYVLVADDSVIDAKTLKPRIQPAA